MFPTFFLCLAFVTIAMTASPFPTGFGIPLQNITSIGMSLQNVTSNWIRSFVDAFQG